METIKSEHSGIGKSRNILYVMVNQDGDVKTFRVKALGKGCLPLSDSDDELLRDFDPENLRGYPKSKLKHLREQGYSLSNWHVIKHQDGEGDYDPFTFEGKPICEECKSN